MPESSPTVRTLAEGLRHEIEKIKGSRFIATLEPTSGREAVERFLEGVREEFRDATHNCFAWRLGGPLGQNRDDWRYSDDGEPSGSAGRPILQEIDGRGLIDVAVVVTRYYGGTKLGTGGLMRAYGGAAAEALDVARIVERPIVDRLAIRFDYGVSGPIQGVLSAHALEPVASDYGSEVRLVLAVPIDRTDDVRRQLIDVTTGSIRFEAESPGD